MLACCLKEWWWSGLSAFCYWKSSFQGLMKKIPLFKNWVFRYSRFGFIWGALVPEVSKLGAALGVLTPYIQSPYFGDWIYRYARSWFYLLDSRLRGPCETAAGSSAEVSLQRFPCSGRGPYFVRTESTDVPGYGFICKAHTAAMGSPASCFWYQLIASFSSAFSLYLSNLSPSYFLFRSSNMRPSRSWKLGWCLVSLPLKIAYRTFL